MFKKGHTPVNIKFHSQEEFVEECKKIHGDRYDYSFVEYKNVITKVEIVCSKHGHFWQMPYAHLNGRGCQKCTTPRAYDEAEETRICRQCGQEFPLTREYFYHKVNNRKGLDTFCILCRRAFISEYSKGRREKKRLASRKWIARRKASGIHYIKMREKNNRPHNKIVRNLMGNIHKKLERCGPKSLKYFHFVELLGCSTACLKAYLESCWEAGMSWDNYGNNGWHIDHIRPCASFDLTDPEQQKECFNWLNLRPMWGFDNVSKSSHYNGKKYFYEKPPEDLPRKVLI